MVETSCPSRGDTEGILLVVSEQTKHTGIPFLCYEDLLISRSTEKDGFYGRKADSLFASLL